MQVMNSIAGDAMPPEGTSFKSSSAPALHKLWVQYHAHNHQWHCPYQLTIVRHILQAMEMCQYFVLNHLGVRLIRCMLYAQAWLSQVQKADRAIANAEPLARLEKGAEP